MPNVMFCCVCFKYSIVWFPIVFYTYAPDNEWFIETMNTVFSLGGDMMHPDLTNSFLKLLSEGEFVPHSCTLSFAHFRSVLFHRVTGF